MLFQEGGPAENPNLQQQVGEKIMIQAKSGLWVRLKDVPKSWEMSDVRKHHITILLTSVIIIVNVYRIVFFFFFFFTIRK